LQQGKTPGHLGMTVKLTPPPQEDRAAQIAQLGELKAKLDEERERLVLLEQILEQDLPYPPGRGVRRQAREVHRQIVGDREPEQPVSRFPRAGQNVMAAKRDAFEMRCRLCSKWQQFSRPRARPLDVEERPQKSVMSQSTTKRRCQSISSHPLKGKRPRSSSQSTTNDDRTHDATLTSIVTIGTGTQKSAVTVPTAAGGTTAMRTGWPRNHRACGCSVGQSAARRCPAHFDPRPALQNTTTRPSQSCGWQISG